MKNLKRLNEIREKGVEAVNFADIPLVFQILCDFINVNPQAQKFIETHELTMVVKIKDAEPYYLRIKDKNAEFNKGILKTPDFVISSDLKIIAKLLLGHLDPLEAYFSEVLTIKGDLSKVILFVEILELAFTLLEIGEDRKDNMLIDTSSMKRLIEVYLTGSPVEPSQVTLFLKVLTAFVNNNPEAKDIISDEDLIIQIKITDLDNYVIHITDSKMEWSRETVDSPNLVLEMSLKTSAEVLINGDPVSAFMAGKIVIQGDITKALIFQSIIDVFLDYINL